MADGVRIGCAGWALRTEFRADFPGGESQLTRYARRFNAVEINTSFYRPHRAATYQRWAASVPDNFSFSLKLPRSITHERRLHGAEAELDRFAVESSGLGAKRGCVLIQLPPSLPFLDDAASEFLVAYRDRFPMQTVIEPRHSSWFTPGATAMLSQHRIDRVMADPTAAGDHADFARPYFRLHGSPRVYYSGYSTERLALFADAFLDARRAGRAVWCIFDNTALGHAIPNALALQELLADRTPRLSHDARGAVPGSHKS